MLKEPEFLILDTLRKGVAKSQRKLASETGLSLGTINATLKKLQDEQAIEGFALTEKGVQALSPHKVDNAIIMAAGMSSRFAPISYERPKGTLTVKGEVLVERIIRQLQEAGITDITVVVGYMKEQFLYLEDAFSVNIVVSELYLERNNHSTLYLVREKLANTYVVASDYYFVENPFEPYVFHGYYAAIYQEGAADEHFIKTGAKDRITKVTYGGKDGWIMYGHTYFDKQFSAAFTKILEETFDLPETKNKLWEDIYADHVKELDLKIKRYKPEELYEFDSLEEVRSFDADFITNIDSEIFNNITRVLGCSRTDVSAIESIDEGLTNQSFYFKVGDGEYVYRHPGVATQGLLDRSVEEAAEKIGYDLGLDKTFIHLDPEVGWKISEFVQVTEEFDYHNKDHVKRAMEMIHKLHDSGITVSGTFDLHERTNDIKARLGKSAHLKFSDYKELDARATKLYKLASTHGAHIVLAHNDFYQPNILVRDDELFLIDWEYSGMSDYASDLGVFICCSDYTYAEALEVLEQYWERALTPVEMAHCVAYVSLCGYYWFVWALLKESEGESVGEWLYLWYKSAKTYGQKAEKLFEELLENTGRG